GIVAISHYVWRSSSGWSYGSGEEQQRSESDGLDGRWEEVCFHVSWLFYWRCNFSRLMIQMQVRIYLCDGRSQSSDPDHRFLLLNDSVQDNLGRGRKNVKVKGGALGSGHVTDLGDDFLSTSGFDEVNEVP